MRLKTYINKLGQIYIPKQIRKKIGFKSEQKSTVDYIANHRMLIILPSNMTTKQAIESLDINRQELVQYFDEEQKIKVTKEEKQNE